MDRLDHLDHLNHLFAYRPPRIDFCFPVEFHAGNEILVGSTKNISEKGFLVDFGEPLRLGLTGRTRFRVGRCTLELEARIVYTEGFSAALAFDFASDQERSFLYALVGMVTQQSSAFTG